MKFKQLKFFLISVLCTVVSLSFVSTLITLQRQSATGKCFIIVACASNSKGKYLLFNPREKKKNFFLTCQDSRTIFLQVSLKKIYSRQVLVVCFVCFPENVLPRNFKTFIIWLQNTFRLFYPLFFIDMYSSSAAIINYFLSVINRISLQRDPT